MGTLSMGGSIDTNHEMDIIEQQRLAALIEITEQHNREVNQLKSRLETAEKKAEKAASQLKNMENELKDLRASNPDRMKKQIKRLQEQNRILTGENSGLKIKQKQLTQQLATATQEIELLKSEESEESEESEAKTEKDESSK